MGNRIVFVVAGIFAFGLLDTSSAAAKSCSADLDRTSGFPAFLECLQSIEAELNETKRELQDFTRLEAELIFSPTNQDIAALANAVAQKRSIYVSYTAITAEQAENRNVVFPDGNNPHKWLRRCDHLSIDNVSQQEQQVSCFLLRLPDTTFREGIRVWEDATVFEDHMITTSGQHFMRKYRAENGGIELMQSEGMASDVYRDAWWYVYPAISN